MPLKQTVSVELELTCEGPRCARGVDGRPLTLRWDAEKAKTDLNAVPDDAFRFINDNFLAEQTPHSFCCRRCQHDYHLANPFSPKSPRELMEQQEADQKRQAEEIAEKAASGTPIPPITPALALSAASPETGQAGGDGA